MPHAKEVFDIAYTHGAYAVYVSGAGPTVMAIVDEDNSFFTGKMEFSMEAAGIYGWKVRELEIDNQGAKIG